jgi:RHS repeat-associated protein
MTYTYSGNQLLSVTDANDKTKGFIDGANTGNDYDYDANGNMKYDLNKSLGTSLTDQTHLISYNCLNMPTQVTKNTNEKIVYTYDASGIKLKQQVYNTTGALIKTTDYDGEFIYQNDTLKFINHEEGRIIADKTYEQQSFVAEYPLDGNANDQSGNGLNGTLNGGIVTTTDHNGQAGGAIQLDGNNGYVQVNNNSAFDFGNQDFSISFWVKKLANSVSWDNNIGICKWNTGASPGTNSWSVGLATGANDNIPSFTIESGTTMYSVSSETSLILNQWYQIMAVKFGSTMKIYINGVLEGINQLPINPTINTTTLPVYIGRLPQGLYTNAVFDEVQILKGQQVHSSTPEYQYHMKDHLGNVRLTFTTLPMNDSNTATYEDANINVEQNKFLRYANARRINAAIFDHTNGNSTTTGYSERLNGSANEIYGLARSMSVMPGDMISAEVYAKYVDPNSNNWNAAFSTLMGQIAANTAGVVVDGTGYSTSTSSFPAGCGGLLSKTDNGAPKAYLNWLVFDRNYVFVTGGFKQITTAAKESGTDGPHEYVAMPSPLTITQPGYVYIYLSNENGTPVEVYFDDFKVTQTNALPVVQQQDYYPFGLTFNSYTRENAVPQNYLYNGKEIQKDLGLNWEDYEVRMYMPDIGRWTAIDPLSEKGRRWSPYNYAMDNPIRFIDPDGMWPFDPGKGLFGIRISISLSGSNFLKGSSVTLGYRNQLSESTSFGANATYGAGRISSEVKIKQESNVSNVPAGSSDTPATSSANGVVKTNLKTGETDANVKVESKDGVAASDHSDPNGSMDALDQATKTEGNEPSAENKNISFSIGDDKQSSGSTIPLFGPPKSSASYLYNTAGAIRPPQPKASPPPPEKNQPDNEKLNAECGCDN